MKKMAYYLFFSRRFWVKEPRHFIRKRANLYLTDKTESRDFLGAARIANPSIADSH